MFRVLKMSRKLKAIKISSIEDDLENIEIFAEEGFVILCEELEELENLGIDIKEIEILGKL